MDHQDSKSNRLAKEARQLAEAHHEMRPGPSVVVLPYGDMICVYVTGPIDRRDERDAKFWDMIEGEDWFIEAQGEWPRLKGPPLAPGSSTPDCTRTFIIEADPFEDCLDRVDRFASIAYDRPAIARQALRVVM